MKSIIKKIARWHHNYRRMKKEKIKREMMLSYIDQEDTKIEIKSLRPFFEKHCFEMIPYSWIEESHYFDVDVKYDKDKKLYYTNWHGKKLYWREGVRPYIIRKNVHALLLEQDDRSPHKYVIDEGINDAILVDVGAAEGCFTLDVIERISHAYLFECDPRWIKALEATFEPYKDKITIVNKYVGSNNDDNTVTLDEYFSDKRVDYIKADIEGAEVDMLKGGAYTLKNKIKEVNICVYHKPADFVDIEHILTYSGYECYPTKGWLCVCNMGDGPKDWLRKGVVLAKKLNV